MITTEQIQNRAQTFNKMADGINGYVYEWKHSNSTTLIKINDHFATKIVLRPWPLVIICLYFVLVFFSLPVVKK